MGFVNNTDNNIIKKSTESVDMDLFFQGKEDSQSEILEKEPIIPPDANTISGMKIVEEVDISGIDVLLSSINNNNKQIFEERETKAIEEEKIKQQKHDEEIEKRKQELLIKRAEEEEKERERIKAEEEAELLAEEKKKKKKKEIKEERKEDNVITTTIKDNISKIEKPTINNPLKNIFRGKTKNNIIENNIVEEIEENVNKREKIKEIEKNNQEEEKKSKLKETKEEKEEKNNWKEKACYDGLTGLKNITAYNIEKDTFSKESNVIFIDINNLKYINDTFGHSAGDTLIREISKIINNYFPTKSYRIGGDEFIIITEEKSNSIEKKIKAINKKLDTYTKTDKSGIIYSCSIGYAINDGEKGIDELREKADKNMYNIKKTYKETHPEYSIRGNLKEDDTNWKELAMIDQKTKLYNKLALSMQTINKTDTIALVRIPIFSTLKREEGDKQTLLLSEIITHNKTEKDKAYFIENGTFIIIYPDRKNTLELIKSKARALSLGTEMTTITNNDNKIDDIIIQLENKLDNNQNKNEAKTYDEKLTLVQRKMKESVKNNHEIVQEEDFAQMLTMVQNKASEILSLFMTSKDFNTLFIFFDVFDFLEKIYVIQDNIDFSYIYAVYPGGALYYGADEYSSEISDLFQRIADGLQTGTTINPKDIQKIEGINIFEKIYIQ